jgi:tetratricopeptide (TPR) repeat protein
VRAAILLVLIAAFCAPALADDKAPPPPPKPVDAAVQGVLDKVAKGDKAAIDELNKLAPQHVEDLKSFLMRAHTSPVEERRELLESIEADVPNEKGQFVAPQRKSAKEEKKLDDLDWLAELQKKDPATPGLGETVADIVAIRALAASKAIEAAFVIFDAAFWDETMIYRDEAGRYLRKMEPYCIPALMKYSQAGNFDRKRYANYQLERLDRQEPGKALSAASGDEQLLIAILESWRQTKHREAVHAVWGKVNADSPRVRAKAREAWRAYIEGPPPKPAPMKKLQLPGGKLTKKEKPLYLTYRELADNELRKWSNELLGTDYPIVDPTLDDSDEDKPKKKVVKIDLAGVTKELFDFYDKQRVEQEGAQWAEAEAKAKAGDLPTATTMLDRLLAANPDHGAKAQMALVYFDYAKQLEKGGKWAEAAAAYSKAHGLAPQGPNANDALAAYHFMLGKSLEAQGKDGGPDYRKAFALKPDYAPAKEAAVRASGGSKPTWMIYGAVIAILIAGGLFAAGMLRRKHA